MSAKRMWFGTRGYETWVPCPAISPDYARSSFVASADYVTGGGGIRDSKNGHNIYTLSYPATKTRDEVRLITDFADGVFDSADGVNLIYWIDPVAADKNVMSQAWATPALACEDAPPLVTDENGYGRPGWTSMPTNSNRYPARAATYTVPENARVLEQYIPIPPGYTAWVGIHGDEAVGDYFTVQPVDGYDPVGSPMAVTELGVTSTLVNLSVASSTASGLVILIDTTPGEFTLYGIVVQILPTGTSPTPGDFISGQGHSGCQFIGKPAKTPLSARLDRIALAWTLKETGMDL